MVARMCTEADTLYGATVHCWWPTSWTGGALEIRRLLRNGRSETHDEMVEKLIVAQHLLQGAWPGATRQQLADEAVRRQAGKVAYRRPAGSEGRQAAASG